MCGIAGYVGIVSESHCVISSMTNQLAHRGPDAQGLVLDENFGVGHCRLAIIDTSSNSNQPIVNSRFVLAYNGEIYNWRELIEDFALEASQINSDTQLLFKLLQSVPVNALVPKLRGIFAFSFVDKALGKTTLVRDKFGTKPMYTMFHNGTRFYGSEIKAFKSVPNWKPKINVAGLRNYLSFQNNFGTKTIFDGVDILPAGSIIEIKHANPMTMTINMVAEKTDEKKVLMDEVEYEEELNRLFEQAIKRNLVADVETGSYLSGGIDSTLIALFSSSLVANFKTFNVGFDTSNTKENEKIFDESETATEISHFLGTDHSSIVITENDMAAAVDATSWAIEDPRVGQSYPNYYASSIASKKVKVCLSGTGGDEIFAGYPWRYKPILDLSDRNSQDISLSRLWHRLGTKEEISLLLGIPLADHEHNVTLAISEVMSEITDPERLLDLNHILKFEQKTFLHGLLLVEDKISMSHGMEVRVPYLDEDLVEFSKQLPVSLKYGFDANTSKDLGKVALRRVLSRRMPEISNLKKQGFSAPDETWFRNDTNRLIQDRILNPKSYLWEFLNYHEAKKLVMDHLSGSKNRRLLIWSLLTLESTLRQFDF